MLMLSTFLVLMGTGADTLRLTLEQTVARGLAVSPLVAAAEGAVAAPRGARAEAIWPFSGGPFLLYDRARRSFAGQTTTDYQWAIRLPVQIAGQNFLRASAAGWRVRAAEAQVRDARRVSALELRLAQARLAVAERRATFMDTTAAFAERLATVARVQLAAGEVNLLEYNAAVLEAARQQSATARTHAELTAAEAALSALLALGPEVTPRAAGLPPLPAADPPGLDGLVAAALASRPDYGAAQAAVTAADRGARAAALDGWVPDLQLGGVLGQEAGQDRLRGFSLGISIPLFRRNQAARGDATAQRQAAQAARTAAERAVRSEVSAAYARYQRGREAARRFAAGVLEAAAENVRLTERAFAEGKVGIADVVLLRSTAVAAQLEFLDVLTEAYGGWFELSAAVGHDPWTLISFAGVEP